MLDECIQGQLKQQCIACHESEVWNKCLAEAEHFIGREIQAWIHYQRNECTIVGTSDLIETLRNVQRELARLKRG